MKRYSAVSTLKTAGNFSGVTTSNAVKVERAEDARIIVYTTANPGGGATLEVDIETSEDNSRFWTIDALDTITGNGNKGQPLPMEKLSRFVRVVLRPSAGTWNAEVKVDAKY